MPVDIQTEIEIERPRSEVAEYASDPDTATSWYENIKAVEWESPKPVAVGSKIAFVAQFLGRRLPYTYEVKEMIPGERFVMQTAERPFPMETTYSWQDTASGSRDTNKRLTRAKSRKKVCRPSRLTGAVLVVDPALLVDVNHPADLGHVAG